MLKYWIVIFVVMDWVEVKLIVVNKGIKIILLSVFVELVIKVLIRFSGKNIVYFFNISVYYRFKQTFISYLSIKNKNEFLKSSTIIYYCSYII